MKKLTAIFLFTLTAHITFAQSARLSKTDKAAIVGDIAASLRAHYIYLDTAERMGRYMEKQLGKGAYDTIGSPSVFADRLTRDLLSVYHDGHLSVSFNPGFANGPAPADTAAERRKVLSRRKSVNFGFVKAEMLAGGISYLKIVGFAPPDTAMKALVLAAFRFVSNGKALIIDLRENHGGDPAMVSYICGLLFSSKTHLNDLYNRSDRSLQQFWALPAHQLPALETIPIYILTSRQTFSAGEEFSYDLQTQKRAIIVGEVTGGGAHPVGPFAVSRGFVANIPFARAINPVTHTNWEGTGVKPDVAVPAEQALEEATKLATAH